MALIIQPRRPARAGEWTRGSAILFIVTLAATGTVTLAARAAGMSRKAAYALKRRDPLFEAAWLSAKKAAAGRLHRSAQGYNRSRATRSNSSIHEHEHREASSRRDRFLAELRRARDSAHLPVALAPRRPTQ